MDVAVRAHGLLCPRQVLRVPMGEVWVEAIVESTASSVGAGAARRVYERGTLPRSVWELADRGADFWREVLEVVEEAPWTTRTIDWLGCRFADLAEADCSFLGWPRESG